MPRRCNSVRDTEILLQLPYEGLPRICIGLPQHTSRQGALGPAAYTILRALRCTLARPIRGARLAQLFFKPMLHLGKRKFHRSVGWTFAPNIPNGPPSIFFFEAGYH